MTTMAYPLERYELDQHVDAGITNLSGTVDAIPHALAAIVWSIDRHCAAWVIGLFKAAFDIDLIDTGSPLGGAVARSTRQLYAHLALPLMTTALTIASLWAVWELLVMRRYARGAGRLGASVCYCVVAAAVALAPASTVQVAARAVHDASRATLAAVLAGHADPTQAATGALHSSLVDEPWILLDFGAAVHCVDARGQSVDPPAGAAGANAARAGGSCLDSHRLAPLFLAYDPGSDQRNHAYDLLHQGSAVQQAAVRIQTGGAGYDRVALALGLLVAALGAFVLVGGLALGMIAAQLYALLLCTLAPAALVCALVPGAGHRVFEVWARQLAGALVRGLAYCAYLSVATALSLALDTAAPAVGQLGSLTLQAILWWGLVVYGRRLSHSLGERVVAAPLVTAASTTATRVVRAVPTPTRNSGPSHRHGGAAS
jgi:hypothetical protein